MKIQSSVRLCLGVLLPLFVCKGVQADTIHYQAALSGSAESPSNPSAGIGVADVYIDTTLNTMEVLVWFSGLTGTVTASHIHAATAIANTGTAGVATQTPTFTGFPLGVTSGTYDHTFDLSLSSTYNASYVTANGGTAGSAEAALLAAMSSEKTYLNIHTTAYPGGEIRGFLHSVPDAASTALLLALALGALGGVTRVRQLRT